MRKRAKKSQRTSNNHYRSGFESKLAHQLKRSGVDFEYETLSIEYQRLSTYTPDFILPNGIIIEAKGVWTVEDRAKHLLVREQHPHLDIRMVFMRASNKISKKSRLRTLCGVNGRELNMQIKLYQSHGFHRNAPTV